MKKRVPYIKYVLDIVMGITFALFYNDRVLGGLAFHEIAGLVICGAFLAHILLNGKWVKNTTLKLFNPKLTWKSRMSYLLNLLLLISMTAIIVTGIIISRVVFPNLLIGNERWFQMLHLSVSYITLVLMAVHVGLHWNWVMNLSKKIIKVKSKAGWMDYVTRIAVILLFLFGAYEMYATGFGTRLASSANIFTRSQQGQFSGVQGQGFGKGQMGENGQPPEGFTEEIPNDSEGNFQENGERPAPPNWDGTGERPSRSDGGFQGDEADGGFKGSGDIPSGVKGERHGEMGQSQSALGVITTYFGIMAVFAILTHYLGKIKFSRKAKLVNN